MTMTVVTEIKYILDPKKEPNACFALEEEMAKSSNGWDWDVNKTTKSYEYVKRRSVEVGEWMKN